MADSSSGKETGGSESIGPYTGEVERVTSPEIFRPTAPASGSGFCFSRGSRLNPERMWAGESLFNKILLQTDQCLTGAGLFENCG